MRAVYDLVAQVAPSFSTVLVQGESGTGKELVARAIHQLSRRSDAAFVVLNSANLPAELLESTLFGHTQGAFTGAIRAKQGLFQAAHGGSLFFDEIGNIDLTVQAKLLRVLQEREFMAVGSTETQRSDVRIIAATNIDLANLVRAGSFREDLYYRINVIPILLPPLRERRVDIPLLIEHFLSKYSKENNKKVQTLTPRAAAMLEAYHWPGNVRELENVIQRAVVLARSEEVDTPWIKDVLRSTIQPTSQLGDMPFKELVDAYQRELIKAALERANGVQKVAAELLGLKPTTLNEKLKKMGLDCRS
jgi:two-component system response regulator PilR (NtrC family)